MMHCGMTATHRQGSAPLPPIGMVSVRQLALLEHLAAGHSPKDTARSLGLLPGMVEADLETMRRRFGARNARHLLMMALTRGIAA